MSRLICGTNRTSLCALLVLGAFCHSLVSGCRSFARRSPDMSDPQGGQAGGLGVAGNAARAGEAGEVSTLGSAGVSGRDGAAGGDAGVGGAAGHGGDTLNEDAGGAAGSADELQLSVDVAESFELGATWDHVLPFLHEGEPHFIHYSSEHGFVTFRRLESDRVTTTTVWTGSWTKGYTAFSRFTPGGEERFVTYAPATGYRGLATFLFELQGHHPFPYEDIGTLFDLHASEIVPADDLPRLYWYDIGSGALLVETLIADGSKQHGTHNTILAPGYHALAAIDGRLLGFHQQQADVFDAGAFGGSKLPGRITDLPPTERVLAAKLDGWSLLICYSLDGSEGSTSILELDLTDDGGTFRELWRGQLLPDARSLTSLTKPGELMLFVHDPLGGELQVVSITAATP